MYAYKYVGLPETTMVYLPMSGRNALDVRLFGYLRHLDSLPLAFVTQICYTSIVVKTKIKI